MSSSSSSWLARLFGRGADASASDSAPTRATVPDVLERAGRRCAEVMERAPWEMRDVLGILSHTLDQLAEDVRRKPEAAGHLNDLLHLHLPQALEVIDQIVALASVEQLRDAERQRLLTALGAIEGLPDLFVDNLRKVRSGRFDDLDVKTETLDALIKTFGTGPRLRG